MDTIERLKRAIVEQMARRVPVQAVWAQCVSVNATRGTMVASREGLDYEDVILGLGGEMIVPEPGSRVLLGLIENHSAATFLLFADRIAERRLVGDRWGGVPIASRVTAELNALQADINQLKALVAAWVPVTQDGGAALKATLVAWSSSQLVQTQSGAIESTTVRHG